MTTLLIALGAGIAFIIAYNTYGRWLGRRIFRLSANAVCPSARLNDGTDYVPTAKPIVFGHHFTSIAGTGPIVGPAIAVMWGWVPALLWVVLGSIFIGAVHDFGALVVSLRNNGQTVGDIAGRVLNRRVRLLFLFVLFLALTIVLAIFGLVIAAVFRQYPAAIFPCIVQIPIAVAIGYWLYRKGASLTIPSLIALALMYLTVVFGDKNFSVADMSFMPGWIAAMIEPIENALHVANSWMASWPTMVWVIVLLAYCYIASVLPVWVLLQPRDYINSLQLLTALGLIVVGLGAAAFIGGAPPVEGAERPALDIVAPAVDFNPKEAPVIFPFLFITIACGAISGFHCLVSSGTSSKQLKNETDARFVGYGAMLTEGFLATLVILACVAGLGLGVVVPTIQEGSVLKGTYVASDYSPRILWLNYGDGEAVVQRGDPTVNAARDIQKEVIGSGFHEADDLYLSKDMTPYIQGGAAWNSRYSSWGAAGSLGRKVGAFVDGAANFLKAIGIPGGVAIALMGVLVASFAGTTLDTACRLQRYVIQELAATLLPRGDALPNRCFECEYDLTDNVSGSCPECGLAVDDSRERWAKHLRRNPPLNANPITWMRNKHGATIVAVVIGIFVAALPPPGTEWTWKTSGTGGLILWPMFGATNQLLGGLSFLVIAFYLWRRKKPIWFLVFPLIFMLIMPAWAMLLQLPDWLRADVPNWPLIFIAAATLVLEAWMIVEAVLLFPKVKGLLEPDAEKMDHTVAMAADMPAVH